MKKFKQTIKALIKSIKLWRKGRQYISMCRSKVSKNGNRWHATISKRSFKRSFTFIIFTITVEFIDELDCGGCPIE